MKTQLAMVLGLVAATALVPGCERLKPIGVRGSRSGATSTESPGAASATDVKDRVKVEMYVMSKCPYGVQAEDGFLPALEEIGSYIDFHLDYIVNEQNGQFTSLHGEPEIKGNIQQLCTRKHYPGKWTSFLSCQNKNWNNIPEGWERCAESNSMDTGKLRSCIEGSQGKDLLRESMKRAQAAGAQGSPTIKLAGEDYNGGRTKNDFIRAICPKIPGRKPEACSKIPEDVAVSAVILTDKRCGPKCETGGLQANIKGRFFPKLEVKVLDYSEQEGKKLYGELGLKYLPVMLFEPGVERAERFGQIARWMEEAGRYKKLKIPAQFDPTAEICDNKIDDTGNGKVDCADPDCESSLVCRKEIPKKLEVFVMSQCPYGVQALNAMREVLDNFKGNMSFDVHYIADKSDAGFSSLHGQPEVDENIRQICAKKHYGRNNKYMDYIWCRNQNIQSADWKPCAKDGIDAAVIDKCFSGDEGKKLLEEDIKIAKALEISGSPTWLTNNKFKFNGIAAEVIKTNFCEQNKGAAGCDKKLSDKAEVKGSCGN